MRCFGSEAPAARSKPVGAVFHVPSLDPLGAVQLRSVIVPACLRRMRVARGPGAACSECAQRLITGVMHRLSRIRDRRDRIVGARTRMLKIAKALRRVFVIAFGIADESDGAWSMRSGRGR